MVGLLATDKYLGEKNYFVFTIGCIQYWRNKEGERGMTKHISKTAKIGHHVIIEDGVTIGDHVEIGPNSIVLANTILEEGVKVGANCVLGIKPGGNNRMRGDKNAISGLVIRKHTKVGNLVSIYANSIIGEGCFIADHASIRENVTVGKDTVIGRGAIVELNTKIGNACTIQTLSYVTGDTVLEDNVFIGPCVSMSNDKYMGAQPFSLKGPTIKKSAKIGNNATLLPGIMIGEHAVVGAGAVVTRDVPDYDTVAGVPASSIKKSP